MFKIKTLYLHLQVKTVSRKTIYSISKLEIRMSVYSQPQHRHRILAIGNLPIFSCYNYIITIGNERVYLILVPTSTVFYFA